MLRICELQFKFERLFVAIDYFSSDPLKKLDNGSYVPRNPRQKVLRICELQFKFES